MSDETEKLRSDEQKPLEFTVLYEYLPDISLYQVIIVILLGWSNILGGSVQFAQIIFQASPDNFTCVDADVVSSVNDCNVTCNQYNYSFYLFDETVDSQFDLICENKSKSSVISSLSIFGLFFGAIGMGTVADKVGRRNALLIASIGCTISSILTAVASPNLWLYTAWRMLAGAFAHGTLPIACVFAMEYVGVKYRSYATAFAYALFDVGIANLSFVGLAFRHWFHQALALVTLPVVFLFVSLWLPKSIAYLYKAEKYDEGKEVLKRFMIQTKTPLSELDELSDKLVQVSESQKSDSDSRLTVLQLFSADFRIITLMCFTTMFAACLGSVGMFLDSSGDPRDLLINNIWLCLFDMIGYLLIPFALDSLGRVRAHVICFATMGTCLIVSRCLLIFCAPSVAIDWAAYILLNVGKCANAITFGGIFSFTAELFPTNLRSSAVGTASAAGRLGGMLAPLILYMSNWSEILPSVIISVICFIAAFAASRMPETKNIPLLQSTSEAVAFYANSSNK